MLTPDDIDMVNAARRGEAAALDQLCARYLPMVLAWARRMGGPRIHAEDVAHDTWMVVMRRIHTVREAKAFPSWLYGTTRKVLASHRRKAWLRRWVGSPPPERADPLADPLDDAERGQRLRALARAMDQLKDHHREILVLCDLEERSDSEVSDLLGIPKGTVKSRLRRARKELSEHLQALES